MHRLWQRDRPRWWNRPRAEAWRWRARRSVRPARLDTRRGDLPYERLVADRSDSTASPTTVAHPTPHKGSKDS